MKSTGAPWYDVGVAPPSRLAALAFAAKIAMWTLLIAALAVIFWRSLLG